MVYDGVVAKIFDEGEDKIFLFFLEPETNVVKDGLNLDDDNIRVYDNLEYDTLVSVEIILKDGTKDIDVDLDRFIGGGYGKYDIFIHIKDLLPFKLAQKGENDEVIHKTVVDVISDGEFQDIAKECIEMTKDRIKYLEDIEKEENREDD